MHPSRELHFKRDLCGYFIPRSRTFPFRERGNTSIGQFVQNALRLTIQIYLKFRRIYHKNMWYMKKEKAEFSREVKSVNKIRARRNCEMNARLNKIGRREFQAAVYISGTNSGSNSSGAKAPLTSRAIFKPGIESNAPHACTHARMHAIASRVSERVRDQKRMRCGAAPCRIPTIPRTMYHCLNFLSPFSTSRRKFAR